MAITDLSKSKIDAKVPHATFALIPLTRRDAAALFVAALPSPMTSTSRYRPN
jgi:hypothetical protein